MTLRICNPLSQATKLGSLAKNLLSNLCNSILVFSLAPSLCAWDLDLRAIPTPHVIEIITLYFDLGGTLYTAVWVPSSFLSYQCSTYHTCLQLQIIVRAIIRSITSVLCKRIASVGNCALEARPQCILIPPKVRRDCTFQQVTKGT